MAVPTIATIAPNVVFTGGHLVTITGTNFRTAYPPPSSNGPLAPPPPTVSVAVGDKIARDVAVTSATSLTAWVRGVFPGTYSVVLKNLDPNGVPIAGEIATSTNAIQARLVDLAIESDFTRLERNLMQTLQAQVIKNVMKTAAVDFDGTPADVFDVPDKAKLPVLAIQGPQIVDDRFYDTELGLVTMSDEETFMRRRIFKTVNLTYRIVGMDNLQVRNMNLMSLVMMFIQNNPTIEINRVSGDPSQGTVEYELAQVGEFTTFTGSSASDIRGFSGSFVIRGFQLEDAPGFIEQMVAERGRTVDTVTVEAQGLLSG